MNWVKDIWQFIVNDYKTHPIRFVLELIAWFVSISCSVTMALTAPNPPWILMYVAFISQCSVFGWAAWTRKSFGIMMNYLLLVTIDSTALIRLILLHVK